MKIEAQVVLSRCKEKRLYGIRMQKQQNVWMMTWAFPIDEGKAVSEGYNEVKLVGNFVPSQKYNGCPFCHTKNFLLCDECGHVSCYNQEKYAVCQWCGNTGETQVQEEMTVTGGAM